MHGLLRDPKFLRYRPGWLLAFVLWVGLIVSGYFALFRYSFAAGEISKAPQSIPPALTPSQSNPRAQLFLALHPRCPRSRATLKELARIQARLPDASDITVLVFKPANEADDWLQSASLDDCRKLNCRILPDTDGKLAASLGSLTSGSIALYDRHGSLRYQGGITAARGHEGDNVGERAVLRILSGSAERQPSLPVFGCPIQQQTRRL